MTLRQFSKGSVSAVALVAVLSSASWGQAQSNCVADSDGVLPGDCTVIGAGQINREPILVNTEPETGPVSNDAGFVLSLDGQVVDGDPQIEDRVRQTDVALANADVKVQLDTLDPTPRLDVEIAGPPRAYGPGDQVRLISESNYPAFIDRAEMRIIDRGASGGPRLISTVAVPVNGDVSVVLPEGRDLVVVHRVYDARGRYDETGALSLSRPDERGQIDDVEEGTDFIARQGIRVNGGTVTVSATNVALGAVLETMGERVRPDPNGRLVIERILPKGDYAIDVAVTGGGQNLGLTRPIEVPGAEWFYVVVADLTYGIYQDGQTGDRYNSTTGRFQYYVNGETNGGVKITSSLDTGEGSLDGIFQRLGEKDPRSTIQRIDPADGYPTYGDDSSSEDTTPTSGRFYLRVQQDESFVVWGDTQASVAGNGFLRNERNLYGLQGHYETPAATTRGDARVALDLYAAQPDQLVGRDVFQGTGGSVYFLRQQDITPGTQNVTVELRDTATGRVIDRITLVEGRDYQINAIQGLITLSKPLTGSMDSRLISTNLSGDETVNLVVQYEFTPTTADVDGFSVGGRAEAWLTNDLRVGVTGMRDETGISTQTSVGVDLRYQMGDNSFVQLDYAESDGPGYGDAVSNDGGLVFNTNAARNSTGKAIKLEAQMDLADMGMARSGVVGGYFEDRTEGFSTLDYQVTAATGDETLYGVYAIVDKPEGGMGYRIYADVYENGVGDDSFELGGEISGDIGERLSYDIGIERLAETTDGVAGDRTDLGLRLAYEIRDGVDLYAFGQGTIDSNGLDENNRFGLGVQGDFGNGWDVGAEVSNGRGGLGVRLLATQTREDNSSTYFGYELDPSRTVDAGLQASDNGGKYVLGGTRQINKNVTVFGENTYDIFGSSRELISAYGVTYSPTDYLSYTTTLDFGQLEDATNGDIERRALSFGIRYEDEDLRAAGRVEVRQDDYKNPAEQDTDAVFVVANANYRISEEARFLFNLDAARTEANGVSFKDGTLVDASIGYAYRPIENERLNVLARYRYFLDDVGQEVDGVFTDGPVQESHVVSLEGNYDIDPQWTIGGKFGGRWTESADMAGDPMVSNDAVLAAVNARYHALHEWDILLEARYLNLLDAGSSEISALGAVYKQIGDHTQVGVGYNFGSFSSDLTDLTFNDQGMFINLVASF